MPKQRAFNSGNSVDFMSGVDDKNITTERGAGGFPTADKFGAQADHLQSMSEFGFTSKLEGISDRVSSEYASKLSSGMGGYPNSRLEGKVVMDPVKLKEIR